MAPSDMLTLSCLQTPEVYGWDCWHAVACPMGYFFFQSHAMHTLCTAIFCSWIHQLNALLSCALQNCDYEYNGLALHVDLAYTLVASLMRCVMHRLVFNVEV
jgi:hypothetical protein